MNSDFNNRDFERFVKQNADQYRMFPSEKVWDGIHAALHKRRRWYGFALALLLITGATISGIILLPENKGGRQQSYLPAGSATTKTKTTEANNADKAVNNVASTDAPAVKPAKQEPGFTTSYADNIQKIFTADNTDNTDPQTASLNTLPVTSPVVSTATANDDASAVQPDLAVNSIQPQVKVSSAKPDFTANNTTPSPVAALLSAPAPSALAQALTPAETGTPADQKTMPATTAAKKLAEESSDIPDMKDRLAKAASEKKAGKKKLIWQLYLAPTVSYRSLTENMEYLSAARYNNLVNGGSQVTYPSDLNSVVTHRPDLGFQLGLRSAYPVSRWFSLTAGIQLGVSKYDIKAYQHPAETATIALRDRSVSAVSTYSNTSGNKESWLRNFYFSASLPLGMELKLSDGDKKYFGIAGTVQPTYVLDNRAYLLSADLKNYAEVPSLTRKWNMNTSFEIFSAHNTGKLKWRLGPFVQYQAMSSFKKNYPIKEHLVNFGLKFGIQLK